MKNKAATTRIDWQEHGLDSVMRFYMDGFKCQKNERILGVEYFLDIQRGRVVFKIIVEEV